MPTPKKVRYHYKRVSKLVTQLARAMSEAHDEDVLCYESDKFTTDSPCSTHYQTENRVWLTMKDQLAEAMREELELELRTERNNRRKAKHEEK